MKTLCYTPDTHRLYSKKADSDYALLSVFKINFNQSLIERYCKSQINTKRGSSNILNILENNRNFMEA